MTSLERNSKCTLLVMLFLLLCSTAAWPQQRITVPAELVRYPDWILYNGKIVTMDDPSLDNSPGRIVQAMAIRGDQIAFLGSDRDILALAGPQTKKLDLKGRLVTPGLIDTHTHLHDWALNTWAKLHPQAVQSIRKTFSVTGKNYDEITRGIELVIKENMAHPLPGQWAWIQLPAGQSGTGIGVKYLEKKEMSRAQLDKLAPHVPVFIGAHPNFLWNTAARNSFLDWYDVDPTDANEHKAITLDTTMGRSLVADFYFDRHLDELANVLHQYLTYTLAGGITTFSSHIVGLRKMAAYRMLDRQGRMPLRFGFADRYCQQVEPDIPGCFLRKGDYAGMGDKYFWSVGLTLGGIDNGPPAICTSMEAPKKWKDKEDCLIKPGNPYWKAIYAAIDSRWRYVVNHTWGDKGVTYVLDIIDQVMKQNPDFTLQFVRSMHYSSDHCGFYPTPAQLPRMKKFAWYVSCDPRALTRSAPYLKIYQGNNASRIAPIKDIIRSGVLVTLEGEHGYDALAENGAVRPVFLYSLPFLTRKNAWGQSIAPQEAIDRVSLMKMATTWASRYVLRQKQIGSLEPGKLADFVVWNKDYFTVPLQEVGTVYPYMTVLGGKIVVLRSEYASTLGRAPIGPQAKWTFRPRVPAQPHLVP